MDVGLNLHKTLQVSRSVRLSLNLSEIASWIRCCLCFDLLNTKVKGRLDPFTFYSLTNYALNNSGKLFVPRKKYHGEMEEKIILQTAQINLNRKNKIKQC